MYKAIAERRSVRKLYVEALVKRGDITLDEAEQALDRLPVASCRSPSTRPARTRRRRSRRPSRRKPVGVLPHIETGVDRGTLDRDLRPPDRLPRGRSRSHPKLGRQFDGPGQAVRRDGRWSTGRRPRRWRIGSLVLEGTPRPPRRRGHPPRHVQPAPRRAGRLRERASRVHPARRAAPSARATFWVYDSLLSEYAALGYEYGYAHIEPRGARAVGGAVRRLHQRRADHHRPVPRRRRGQVGPAATASCCCCRTATRARAPSTARHASSASSRCAPRTTSRSCNATTAAQYFHLLRRQVRRERAQAADRVHPEVAAADEAEPLARSTSSPPARSRRCSTIRSSPTATAVAADRVLLAARSCWDAMAERDKRAGARRRSCASSSSTRSRRSSCSQVLERYPNARELVWLQEEPENMGPWNFVEHRTLADQGARLRPAPRRPRRERQPGHRLARRSTTRSSPTSWTETFSRPV